MWKTSKDLLLFDSTIRKLILFMKIYLKLFTLAFKASKLRIAFPPVLTIGSFEAFATKPAHKMTVGQMFMFTSAI